MKTDLPLFVFVVMFFATVFAAAGPVTNLHTIPAPPSEISQTVALGFNLVMIQKRDDADGVTILNGLPAGTKGLVHWPGWCVGATPEFTNWAQRYANNPKLYGFYLFDEPTLSTCAPVNVKAATDWVHENMPDIKTFLVLNEQNSEHQANYAAYADAVDLLGLDPYPCWPGMACWFNEITKVVSQALIAGVPREKIVPVYQAFEGDGIFRMPTADEVRQILATWGAIIPNPVFDYTFSWTAFGTTGWKTLRNSPEQREEFRKYFASIAADTQAPTTPTNLTASAVSSSQINLAWTASMGNVGVTGYDIYRGGTLLTSVTGTSYQNTGLAPTTTYTYQVRAKDAAGNVSALPSVVSATTLSGATPLPSPVGWWKFDENSGTTANDSSGNNNTGTLVNAPTWTKGKIGHAINFDGSNDYIRIPHSTALDPTDELTYAAWINADTVTGDHIILQKNDINMPPYYVKALSQHWNVLRMHIYDGADNYSDVIGGSTINAREWRHVAVTIKDNNFLKIYQDGIEVYSSYTVGDMLRADTKDFTIGAGLKTDATWKYFDGKIDDVRIYNRALSVSDVQQLYSDTGSSTRED